MHDGVVASILWRRLDRPGAEAARVSRPGGAWKLEGSVVLEEQGNPCALRYLVTCDATWHTQRATVHGWIGPIRVDVSIEVGDEGQWTLNGDPQPQVAGCVDIDLQFSPVTNTVPVRRLALAVRESAMVRAAWLRFPTFTLEPLDQVYRRLRPDAYLYESHGGAYAAQLDVNDAGLVTRYGDVWRAEASNA